MSNRNRSQVSPPMSSSDRIRRLWPDFKQSVSKSRVLLQHKVEALLDKAEKEYEKTPPDRRRPIDQHNALKASLAKQVREPHFKSLRRQWELKLQEVGLRMEDWTDITNEEMASVIDVLGDPGDEPDDSPVVPDRLSPPNQSFSSPSLSSYAPSPSQPLAPALSSSTRSTNVSTASSYALVDPSEFLSEEEDSNFFFPVATSYDLTSDDDEGPTRRRQNGFDAWSSDSSSHHSFNRPFPSSSLPPNPRKMTSAGKQAVSLKAKEDSGPKTRQSYVSPIVSDPDEPLSEEDDFERFKMNIRFQKIIEFHQAAAHADIELAIAIYKDRMAQISDKHEVSSKVTNHQKRMVQLQMEKEEERKNIVKAERSKRRSELRRRPGRSGTLIAPRPSVPANPAWLTSFQEQVAGEVESNIVLDKILSSDPDEQEGNVEKLLGQLFPGSSSVHENGYNHFYPADQSSASNGWAVPTTSFPRPTEVNQEPTPKKFPNGRSTKNNNSRVARPSLFGEDPESSDEEDDSPSPPVPVPAPPQHNNPFMDSDADSMLAQHLMNDPEIYSFMNQWGATSELSSIPTPTTATWDMGQAMQTPTVDNPDPWKIKDVRSTPVATRRKASFSSSLPAPMQNPYNAFMAEQSGMSLATLAAFNSANANAREKQPVVVDERRSVPEPVKKYSPPQSTSPATAAPASLPSTSAQPPVAAQAKVDPNPMPPATGKKQNKKQRLAMKKSGAAGSSSIEDSNQTTESPVPPAETTPPMATIFQRPGTNSINNPQVEANLNSSVIRGRKDSTSAWGSELLSTPRPASNIPAHLQQMMGGLKGTQPSVNNKPVIEQFRPTPSGMSTIKAPPRGLKNRAAWSIFSSAEPGLSKAQTEEAVPSGGRDPWIPGSFEVDDGGGGGQDDDEASFSTQLFSAAPSATNRASSSVPVALQGHRSNDVSPPNAGNSKATPAVSQQQPTPAPVLSPTNKKGKGKKGKGKKVMVEEVPEEDDQDSRGERLPVDHRYIMESNSTILEPKPSVPPRMFESIFGFGGDDEEGEGTTTSSSFSTTTAAAASSSNLPPFDGDPAQFAAAMQEIQEASARMENKFVGTPSWGVNNNGVKKTTTTSSSLSGEAEAPPPPVFAWGQASSLFGEKKKGVGNGNVNGLSKPAIVAPALQNLKRNKAASGGKLL